MADMNAATIGSLIFADIESNEYLLRLYQNILYNYGMHKLLLKDSFHYLRVFFQAMRLKCIKKVHAVKRQYYLMDGTKLDDTKTIIP